MQGLDLHDLLDLVYIYLTVICKYNVVHTYIP